MAASSADGVAAPLPAGRMPLWQRLGSLAIAIGLVALVAARIDFDEFLRQVRRTNYVGFFGLAIVTTLLLMTTDSFATVGLYRRTIGPLPFREFFIVRAASYLPSLLNYHLGQAWATYFIAKVYRAPLWRVAGSTLLAYATILGCILLFAACAIPFNADRITWLIPVVAGMTVLALLYLACIALAPGSLKRWQTTAPLIETGVRGHLVAFAYRIPHMIVLFLATWLPFFFFGVRIPLGYALAAIPPLMLVAALPITPQGIGTRDVLAVQLFSQCALGSPEERRAVIVATTLSWAVTLIIVQAVVSPLFMRRARRLLAS